MRKIVRGDGGNHKLRFEMGVMGDHDTGAIRASQCHSESPGAADDILPAAEDLLTISHGTSLQAEKPIAHGGISKDERLRIHFYEGDLEGRAAQNIPRPKLISEVIVVASAAKCDRLGMVSYKAPRGAILKPGIHGVCTGIMHSACAATSDV